MKLVDIFVGKPKTIEFNGNQITTAIFKKSILGPVAVKKNNIDGDEQADLKVHGGLEKAVYAYSLDAYQEWNSYYKKTFSPGSFGENLLIDSFDEKKVGMGDTYRLGSVVLQVAQPRIPCYKLGVRLNDVTTLKTFNQIQRCGIYFRVLEEGKINQGEKLILMQKEDHFVSVHNLFSMYLGPASEELYHLALKLKSLNPDWRKRIEKALKT
jgi:MOSC domain-containing protein YiiM